MRASIAVWLLVASVAQAQEKPKAATPIPQAHAHNDYEHPRPVLDALDQGFCSVEADIFLVKDTLLVAHTPFGIKAERSLQKLYLDPLRERAKANGGRIYPDGPPFFLLIDVKTEAKITYAALSKVLADYSDILTTTKEGKSKIGAVKVVVSGNCDREAILAEKVRCASIDGRPKDLEGKESAELIPWVSDNWRSQFKWDGKGAMPEDEKKKMRAIVKKAHEQGRLVRFWAAPDNPECWAEQQSAGVDLINTDKLADLREHLLKVKK